MHSFFETLKENKFILFFLITGFIVVAFPTLLFSATPTFVALEGVPGIPTSSGNLPQYLNSIYKILITLGAMVACIKIIIAGVKYSFSGIVTDKAEAKHEIQGALFGLAILLLPFVVLTTINPNLASMNILRNAGGVRFNLTKDPTSSQTPAPAPAAEDTKSVNQKTEECANRPGYRMINNRCTPLEGTPIPNIPSDVTVLRDPKANDAAFNKFANTCPVGTRADIINEGANDRYTCTRVNFKK